MSTDIAPGLTNFADFQNEALSPGGGGAGDKVLAHEGAAHEKRNWVRLSYDCNNHCTFCLDSNAHDGTMRANMDIKIQIIEGRKKGATRLILSGGEPTIRRSREHTARKSRSQSSAGTALVSRSGAAPNAEGKKP